ncbi:metallophosphoesterase family protein [Raoultibacter massiliensis]|uniref:DNA repair exonuclease n=1 Tax=Raoultibacter massiliensis TaxID=1852371 RepID=A0ABV1JEI6_9ACTN|nr:DNA repair exonuclease [Raoultibacter massiliensis]
MPKRVTFIHAADLHLGAPFRGLRALSDTWADRLLSAIPESYDRVIEAAVENNVDFVVIAGDIFDSARASYADYLHFFDGLHVLDRAGIPAYLCTGNHDPFTSWKQDFFAFPPNTFMFSADKPSFEVYERDGEPLVLLGGRGYYNQTWPFDRDIAEGVNRAAAEEATKAAAAPFAVGVLHTGLNLDNTKAPTDPTALMRTGMDYWALGHIHKRYLYPEDNPMLVFSGCIQGRDVNETGERGVFKVTLTEGAPNQLEFIPTASVVWQKMRVDVEDCASIAEVNEKIMRELFRVNGKSHCEEMCVRIELVGKTQLHRFLESPSVLADLRKSINDSYAFFFCDTLTDRTEMPIDKKALAGEGLFPAVLMQVAHSQKENAEESLLYLQDEFMKKNLTVPRSVERSLDKLADEAENLVLDLLGQGEVR